MNALTEIEAPDETGLDLPDDWLLLSDPDLSAVEAELVQAALNEPRLSAGPMTEHFEKSFAAWLGRRHAVAVASGTLGTWLALPAMALGTSLPITVEAKRLSGDVD